VSYQRRKYKTLNLNISDSTPNIKNLICNFGAINVKIMHANFQASSFTGVGGEWGDRQTHTGCEALLKRSLYKISKLLPNFAWDGLQTSRGNFKIEKKFSKKTAFGVKISRRKIVLTTFLTFLICFIFGRWLNKSLVLSHLLSLLIQICHMIGQIIFIIGHHHPW